jgi:hypothetical protein
LSAALAACAVFPAAPALAQTAPVPSSAPLPAPPAADKPLIAPEAAWIHPLPPVKAPTDTIPGPLRDISDELQGRFGPDADEFYTHKSVQVLTTQGLAVGNLAIAWNPETDVLTLNHIRILRGAETIDVLKTQKPTVLRRENNLERAMLDGSLTAVIQPEGLQVGDIIDFAYTIRRHDPTLQNHSEFYGHLEGTIPIDHAFGRFVWSKDKPVRLYQTKDLPQPKTTTTADGDTEVVFDLKDVKPLKFPEFAPTRYRIKGTFEFTQFADWAEVSSVMAPLYAKAENLSATSPLKAEAAKIAAASTDPKVRASAALRLVEDRIRYLYLGMNLGAYTPADADVTWTRKFGDCKAKTVVLMALLKELGIEAQPVFVSSQFGDGLDERLPAMESFDHVLVRAHIEGKTYWLDGTRLGDDDIDQLSAPAFVWGLPVQTSGATLAKIEATPPAQPLVEMTARIDARGGLGLAPVHIVDVMRGDAGYQLKLLFDNAPADKRDDGLKAMVGVTGYAWVSIDKISGGWNDKTHAFEVTADGSGQMDWERLARGQPLRYQTDVGQIGDVFATKREAPDDKDLPFAIGFPRFDHSVETILLPRGGEGFSLSGAGDIQTTLSGVEYARKVKLDKGTVATETTARALVTEVTAAQALADHNKLRDLHEDVVYIQGPLFWRDNDAEIAIRATRDATSMQEYMDRGEARRRMGQYDKGMADFGEAIKAKPDLADPLNARCFARAESNRDLDGAMADCNAALDITPRSAMIIDSRAFVWFRMGKLDEALKDYDRAITLSPEEASSLYMRGVVKIRLGHADEGQADVKAALALDPFVAEDYARDGIKL